MVDRVLGFFPKLMITQTEFAAKIVQNSHVCCEKEDEKILLIRLRFTCFVSWLETLPQPTVAHVCASSMVVRRVHQHLDLGLKIKRVSIQNMILLLRVNASLNTGGLVGSQGRIHLRCYRSVIAGWKECSMVSTRVAIFYNESHSAELVGCRSTSNVYRPGIRRMGNAVFAGADSRFVRFSWCFSGDARETSCVCYRL